jgi:hypothetical protein
MHAVSGFDALLVVNKSSYSVKVFFEKGLQPAIARLTIALKSCAFVNAF